MRDISDKSWISHCVHLLAHYWLQSIYDLQDSTPVKLSRTCTLDRVVDRWREE